jgi:hypothetical protein
MCGAAIEPSLNICNPMVKVFLKKIFSANIFRQKIGVRILKLNVPCKKIVTFLWKMSKIIIITLNPGVSLTAPRNLLCKNEGMYIMLISWKILF